MLFGQRVKLVVEGGLADRVHRGARELVAHVENCGMVGGAEQRILPSQRDLQ